MRNKMVVVVVLTVLIAAGLLCSHFLKPNMASARTGMNEMVWEKMNVKKGPDVRRLRMTGGWLVLVSDGTGNGVTFMPDKSYQWQ